MLGRPMRSSSTTSSQARLAIAATALVVVVLSHASPVSAAGTAWRDVPLQQALEQAQRERKWVLIDVFAEWCVPCQKMDQEIYPREEVGRAIAASFVPLRRDGEKGEGLTIAQRYHVVGFPTLLVIDPRGVEVDRIMGERSATELVVRLVHLRDGRDTLARLEAELARVPSEALKLEVATRHAMRGDPRAVSELTEIVAADADNKSHRAAAALLTLGKYYYLRGAKDYAHAEATLADLEQRFPTTDEASQATYARAIALQNTGRAPQAAALLDAWIAGAPKDRDRVAAYAWFAFKEGGDKARGIAAAKRGLTEWPDDDALWDTLGELYFSTGNLGEARNAFSKAAALRPKSDYYQRQLSKVGGAR